MDEELTGQVCWQEPGGNHGCGEALPIGEARDAAARYKREAPARNVFVKRSDGLVEPAGRVHGGRGERTA